MRGERVIAASDTRACAPTKARWLHLALAAIAISACGQAATPAPAPTPSPIPPPELAVDATDGTITGPDTVAAGWIKLSAQNLKPRTTCGLFVRLNDGVTPSAFAEAIKAGPTPQVQAMVSFEGSIPFAAPASSRSSSSSRVE